MPTDQNMHRPRRMHPVAIALVDIALIGICLVVFALFDHVLPRTLSRDITTATLGTATASASTATTSTASAAVFTDDGVEQTDTSYTSDDVSVTLRRVESGGVTYYVEDIYVADVSHLRSAFAQDTYGSGITESVLSMATDNDAIAAVNGDYYGIGSTGVVIRNGELYESQADGDVCVLFSDGTMKVYSRNEFDAEEVMAAGAWQAWDFGPSLLSESGAALDQFGSSRIARTNPRTAIGYFEPGHYCFVVVDGRQAGYSEGMSLASLSQLMKDLGCTVAYNLDGGKSSTMTFEDEIANQPTEGGRTVTDIVYVAE